MTDLSVSDSFADVVEAGHRGAGHHLAGRAADGAELPLATVRALRPHAARRSTTVPLLAIEIVEAAVDLGCVEDLIADRAPSAPTVSPAARFTLNLLVGGQLRPFAVRRGVGIGLLARALVEAALDQGHVDRLLYGRFDRGEVRPGPRLTAPPRPALPPVHIAPVPAPADVERRQVAEAVARLIERIPGAARALAPASWRAILAEVSTAHEVTIDDMVGPGRGRSEIVSARFEAAYRLWRELDMSLSEVGCRLGGRDHTSILHAIRRHAARHGLPLERVGAIGPMPFIVVQPPQPAIDPTPIETLAPAPNPPPPAAAPEPPRCGMPQTPPKVRLRPIRAKALKRSLSAILADAAAGHRALGARR